MDNGFNEHKLIYRDVKPRGEITQDSFAIDKQTWITIHKYRLSN
jgi:hypothetical protein